MSDEFYRQRPEDFYQKRSSDWMRLHQRFVPYRRVELPKFQDLLDVAYADARALLKSLRRPLRASLRGAAAAGRPGGALEGPGRGGRPGGREQPGEPQRGQGAQALCRQPLRGRGAGRGHGGGERNDAEWVDMADVLMTFDDNIQQNDINVINSVQYTSVIIPYSLQLLYVSEVMLKI